MGIKNIVYWQHFDKVLHTSVGFGISFATSLAFGPWVGIATCNLAAWGKEGYDSRHPDKHTPDPWDAVWTNVGGVIGATLVWLAQR